MKREDFRTPEELENLAWLEEAYLNPLKELGFDFETYHHIMDEDCGTHYLRLESITMGGDPENPVELPSICDKTREDDYQKMIDICTQDDDGQPHATYRYYCGTLFIYIPYFA